MRPTLDEILNGIEISFGRDLMPELESEWAKRIASVLLDAIGHVRLRLVLAKDLAIEEYEDITALLVKLGGNATIVDGNIDTVTLAGLEQANIEMRTALDELIRGYTPPSKDENDQTWKEILGYCARQLGRERRLIPIQG